MKTIGAVVVGASLATLMALALAIPNARAQEKAAPAEVDCAKVMQALLGPDIKPRDVAGHMHIPLHTVRMCMEAAKKSLGTSHPVMGPGGAETDPNDPATQFKHGAW